MSESEDRQLISFDWAIKKLLRSKANFAVLEGFLSELLFDDIKIEEVLESESNQNTSGDKYNRVDIKVRNSKKELVIIEVQFNDSFDFFHRILYGTSKTICDHIATGDSYNKVVKVISVNILYFDLGQGNDYIYKGKTEFKGLHGNDILQLSQDQQSKFNKLYPAEIFPEFYIIKVNNFDNIAKTPLDQWIYLLRNSAVKADFNAKGIKEAEKALNIMKMSKEERIAYERYLDESRLSDSLIKTAESKGKREGISIGKEEGIAIGEKRGIAIGKEEGIYIGEKRGDERGIRNLIESLREVSVSDQIIIEKLQQKYSLALEEAKEYLNF